MSDDESDDIEHVIVSLKALDNAEPHYHTATYTGETFRPACGVNLKYPVVARLADLPTKKYPRSNNFKRCYHCKQVERGQRTPNQEGSSA